mmetsp:Transcript_25853/g.22779  ORF Transcript_25853/g.22779 Transcript_25853/m.22779 type:complete len:128 (+) Transcript_25853:661-1044(+)
MNWKKLARESLSLCYDTLGRRFMTRYFFKVKQKEFLKYRLFTKEEDDLIVSSIQKYGKDWERISDMLINRDPAMLKNRYYYLIKRGFLDKKTHKWTSKRKKSKGKEKIDKNAYGDVIKKKFKDNSKK